MIMSGWSESGFERVERSRGKEEIAETAGRLLGLGECARGEDRRR